MKRMVDLNLRLQRTNLGHSSRFQRPINYPRICIKCNPHYSSSVYVNGLTLINMAHQLYYHIRVKLSLSKPPMFGGANTLLIVFGVLTKSLSRANEYS